MWKKWIDSGSPPCSPQTPSVQVGAGRAALLDRDLHQDADAVDVEGLERRHGEDALVEVAGEERGLDVVAGEPPRGLGEVVGAEGEELGDLGDPVRR